MGFSHSINPPPLPPENSLTQWIDGANGRVSFDLICLFVLTNSFGDGAMDRVAKHVKEITDDSNLFNTVQTDAMNLNDALTQIEKEFGLTKLDPKNLPPLTDDQKKYLTKLQADYKKLFGEDGSGTKSGDLFELKKHLKENPDLAPMTDPIMGIIEKFQSGFAKDLDTTKGNNFGNNLLNNFDLNDWSKGFLNDVHYLADKFYNAHDSGHNNGNTENPIDDWVTAGDTAKQMMSSQTQQDTTKVQTDMQSLQGYNTSGQNILSAISQLREKLVQNQKSA